MPWRGEVEPKARPLADPREDQSTQFLRELLEHLHREVDPVAEKYSQLRCERVDPVFGPLF